MKYDFSELTIPQIDSIFRNMGYESTIDPKPGESDFVVALRTELTMMIFAVIDEAENERQGKAYAEGGCPGWLVKE